MNKKFVTLLSVVVLSSATTTFADTLSLGGDSKVTNDTTSIVATPPTETKPTEEKPKEDKSSVVIGGESEKPIDDKTGGIVVTPTEKEKPAEAPAEKPAPKVNDNLDLGGDSEKQQDKDGKGIVVDSPTPSAETKPTEEKPKEEQPKTDPGKEDTPEIKKEKQEAEENVGVKEKDTPQPLNVTKEEIKENPIETNTGHTIVSTNQGKVVVETEEGDYQEKEPYEVGAIKQQDGTIALKDKEGQLKVLPNTGTASTIFATIWGLLGLIATIWGRVKLN